MTESKGGSQGDVSADNVLRIVDELVYQVDRTKRLVVLMIVVIIIGIPLSWHVSSILLGTPDRLVGAFTIAMTTIAFLAIGVRQWTVLSKWTKRYKAYRELQKKIDEKLDFEST